MHQKLQVIILLLYRLIPNISEYEGTVSSMFSPSYSNHLF